MKFSTALLLALVPAVSHAKNTRELRKGMKKSSTGDSDTESSSKMSMSKKSSSSSSKELITDPYEFLDTAVKEGWCTAAGLKGAFACMLDVGDNDLAAFGILLSLTGTSTITDLNTYCCTDFYEYADVNAMIANNVACVAEMGRNCIIPAPQGSGTGDKLFLPYPNQPATTTDPMGACCTLVFPTM